MVQLIASLNLTHIVLRASNIYVFTKKCIQHTRVSHVGFIAQIQLGMQMGQIKDGGLQTFGYFKSASPLSTATSDSKQSLSTRFQEYKHSSSDNPILGE
jgi:hypothetical protein